MTKTYAAIVIAVISAVTIIIRFLPFVIFRNSKQTPPFIEYLGKVLPYAIMGMLVIYCLRNVSFSASPHGIPELVSIAVIVVVHFLRKNSLLSILSGTLCYVLIVNFIV